LGSDPEGLEAGPDPAAVARACRARGRRGHAVDTNARRAAPGAPAAPELAVHPQPEIPMPKYKRFCHFGMLGKTKEA